ncbi:chemotaxis response regulator protein-glutamate methylesterase [Nisaea acidiphila]|uniref:Protein-glutamate methylesterase/protein-glutamine glutaminase n=1 Tax=Nisaea acidiphila TaxID=1862145 RepID=A0A9J7AYL5_9PROT|nr:chemotaxis response regulator protein-glutamate methylesterase [Nisaea acidiphila]UUX50525.1 chemotaxis response regulator protein-glutamate methylesterase [Nisaea acidiphila]
MRGQSASAEAKPRSKDPYRVMLVDDSAVIRGLFTRFLEADPDVKIVASVGDGQRAIDTLKNNDIEIIVLDIEMPRMDGITALPELLKVDPKVQIVMASTLTARNAEISLKALSLGARDYLTKPSSTSEMTGAADFPSDLLSKVKAFGAQRRRKSGAAPPSGATATARAAASGAPAAAPRAGTARTTARPTAAPASGNISLRKPSGRKPDVIAIGSSTGGPQALFRVLSDIPKTTRLPIFVTQHMPPTFTTILAEHITKSSGWVCSEAKSGDVVAPGRIYLAPGGYHMTVKSEGTDKVIALNQDPPENFCRPAVDPMIRSLIKVYGRVLAVILTGMGHDGREGCRAVVEAGGDVVAQDENTSVVWGMPGAVAQAGLCCEVLPVADIGASVQRLARG